MISIFDTSALFKKYVDEPGSASILTFINESDLIYASSLVKLEICSTLEVSKNTSRINSPTYRAAFKMLEKDFNENYIRKIDITEKVITKAFRLIRQRRLRAPDAIQLASALELREQIKETTVTFICSDQRLIDAAKLESMKVFNPV